MQRRFESSIKCTASSEEDFDRIVSPFRSSRYASVAPGFKFRPGYIYTAVRAISARVNQNYDAWPSAELKKYYKTFINRPVFVNHGNEDPNRARGRVAAARYIDAGNGDKYIECIMETDAKRFPKLAHEIRTGGLDSVSMGVEAGFTICSVCKNKAADLHDMCDHIRFHKGEYVKDRKTGKKQLVYEDCYKLGFFELSYVFDPADETAVVSRVIAAGKRTAEEYKPIGWDRWAPNKHDQNDAIWHPNSQQYQDHAPPNTIKRNIDPSVTQAYDNASPEEKAFLDPLDFYSPYKPSKEEYQVRERDRARNRLSWYKQAADPTWIPNTNPDTGEAYPMPDWKHEVYVHRFQPAFMRMAKTGQPQPDLWSVGTTYTNPDTGERKSRVHGYTDQVHLANPRFVVTEGGAQKALDSGVRNVHAKVYGTRINPPAEPLPYSSFNYDPFNPDVRSFYHRDDMEPIYQADHAHFGPDGRSHAASADNWGRAHAPNVVHPPGPTLNASNPETVMSETKEEQGRKMRHQSSRLESPWGRRIAESNLPRLLLDKAPEDIDTLRNESEDDTDLFHHWVQSPPDLRAPDLNKTKQEDMQQEQQGLDVDRRAEDAEEYGAPADPAGGDQQFLDEQEPDPVMPINPPTTKKSRRTQKEIRMSRYFYAEDEDGGEDTGEYDSSESNADDVDSLLDEAESDIDAYQSGEDDDPDGDGDDDSSEEGDTDDDYAGDDEDDDDSDSGEDSGPPWADEKEARTVRRRASRGNKRGGTMSRQTLASRNSKARHFQADDSGHTDGGPYGVDDSQGAQEEVFISQVPGAEAVETGGDGQIDNSPGNLVAKRSTFDPAHYQRIADVVRALPPAQRGAMAAKMVRMFQADNRRFNPMTFFEAAQVPMVKRGNRYFIAEDLVDPDRVDPSLSGTDAQDLKGDDFESLALEDVETQPKDASIHAFRTFDSWLAKATGKTARQHGNANFIRRAAASYCKQARNPQAALNSLFPTLEYVLAEARKVEGRTANMRKRAEDTSLDVAAPEGRIDVEAPVKNVTDADAQASQFDLSDFAGNAGDNLADPVLDPVDGNAGTWAPDKEASTKLATGVEAVRLADAYIAAYPNTYSAKDRWQLTARFETLRQPVVRDRIRVLEAVVEDGTKSNKRQARKVTAASSRGTNGIPQGLGQRTAAGARKVSATDPATDYGLFI